MAMTLEELQVIIDARIEPYKRKMKELEGKTKQATNAVEKQAGGLRQRMGQHTTGIATMFSRLARLAAFAYIGRKLIDVGVYSTQMALEVTAAVNQVKRQMGESSQLFLKWAERNAAALNMSTGEAIKYGSVYSNLFSSFIKDSQKLSAYTGKMLQTSAVVAEGTGRSITDVMERIRSGLLGNTEAIEDLGINVNVAMIESTEAFKKFAGDASWNQLDFQTQQQIRLMAILEQATAKYGDTLSNSVNGRVNLFKSLLKDTALNIGNAILPVINAMMPVLNSLAMALKNVTAKLAEFVSLMFNKKATVKGGAIDSATKGIQNATAGAGDLTDALGGADDATGGMADNLNDGAKAAKKAVKELMGLAGFDEITTLNVNKDADSNGAGGGSGGRGKGGKGGAGGFQDILPEVELTDMNNQFKSVFDGMGARLAPLFDYFKKLSSLFGKGFELTFRYDSIERFKTALNGIWESLKFIFEDGRVLSAAARFGEKLAFALGQVTGATGNVIMGIAVFIAESLNKSLEETKLDIKNWLIRQFDILGEVASSLGNIASDISHIFYETFTSIPATDIGSHIVSALFYSSAGVFRLGGSLARDLLGGIETTLSDNKEKVVQAFSGLLSAVSPLTESLKNLFRDTFKTLSDVYNQYVGPSVDRISSRLSNLVGVILDTWNAYVQPLLDSAGALLTAFVGEHVQPAVDSLLGLVGRIVEVISYIIDGLGTVIGYIASNIVPVLAPILESLVTVFVEAWNTIADIVAGALEILNGIIDFIVGIFTADWQRAWDGIKGIFQGFSLILSSIGQFILTTLVAIFKAMWETIVAIFKAAWDSIVVTFTPFVSWFTDKAMQAWQGITIIFSQLGPWFNQRWLDVQQALSNVATWFGNIFGQAWASVTAAFSGVAGFFRGIYDTIVSWFSNIGSAIAGSVSGAFRSAMNGALGTVENAVNSFIGMINSAIGMINKVPGVNLGPISPVSLPRLARGGIVDSPTIAMIGEAGKEVVMPLENTGFLQTMGRVVGGAVVNALGGQMRPSGGFSGEIVINIGGREFGRFAIDAINEEQARAGQLLLNI